MIWFTVGYINVIFTFAETSRDCSFLLAIVHLLLVSFILSKVVCTLGILYN